MRAMTRGVAAATPERWSACRLLVFGLMVAVLASMVSARAQEPSVDGAANRVHLLEVVSADLRALERVAQSPELAGPLAEHLHDYVESQLAPLLEEVGEREPDLLTLFRDGLDEVVSAAAAGSPEALERTAFNTRQLVPPMLDRLIDRQMQSRLDVRVEAMRRLLLASPGVVQAYVEVPSGEAWRLAQSWSMLASVKHIWGDLLPFAGDRRDRIEEPLVALDDMLNSPFPQELPAYDSERVAQLAERFVELVEGTDFDP